MDNPGLSEPLWRALDRRLWHAPSPDCLAGTLANGWGWRIMGAETRQPDDATRH